MNDSISVENIMIAARATRITSLEEEFETALNNVRIFLEAEFYKNIF